MRRRKTKCTGYALLIAASWVLGGCGASSKGSGSETHFVECRVDEDCNAVAPYCASRRCSSTAPVPSVMTDATEASPSTSATDSSSIPDDGTTPTSMSDEGPPGDVTDSAPSATSNSADEATSDASDVDASVGNLCGAEPSSCCSNDGTLVDSRCSVDGVPECPPASAPLDAEVGCGECPMPPLSGSFSVEFSATNRSGAPIGLWSGCQTEHRVTACADGYAESLHMFVNCAPLCPDTVSPTCGACYDSPLPVTAEAAVGFPLGSSLFRQEGSGTQTCVERLDVPGGSYRVTVPVFSDTPLQIPGGGYYVTALYEITVDFELPDEDGIVEIPIDASPYVQPCADGVGTCVLPQRAELPPECELDNTTPNDCPETAPVRYHCSTPVPLGQSCIDPLRYAQGGGRPDGVIRCCPGEPVADAGLAP
jgi:hypothetical protein